MIAQAPDGPRARQADADVNHPLFARAYHRVSLRLERLGRAAHRDRLVGGVAGRVIEIGPGPGFNFRFYPERTTVLALEPEPHLRGLAAREAASVPAAVNVACAVGERLPAADSTFDAAVLCLVLCSVQEVDAVLQEVRRVLRPGGELRFYEHVRAQGRALQAVQRAARPLWLAALGGCDPTRTSLESIERAGFDVRECERFLFRPWGVPFPTAPRILGRAISP